jgi:hypothetical protein
LKYSEFDYIIMLISEFYTSVFFVLLFNLNLINCFNFSFKGGLVVRNVSVSFYFSRKVFMYSCLKDSFSGCSIIGSSFSS